MVTMQWGPRNGHKTPKLPLKVRSWVHFSPKSWDFYDNRFWPILTFFEKNLEIFFTYMYCAYVVSNGFYRVVSLSVLVCSQNGG